jgi:PKD repeat protein
LVENSQPIALDISVAQWVLRDGSVDISANGSDMEDSEDDLIPHFSYKAPGNPDWEDAFFTALKYEDDQWNVKFSPDISSEDGSYIIRIIFEDEDGSYSDSIQDSCQVRNNPPEAGDIRVSATTLFRTDTIIIRSKGNDVEDDSSDLVATFQYKPSSDSSWKSTYLENQDYNSGTGYHTIEFTPLEQADFGDYDFRVRFEDTDGDDSSWVYKNESVEVKTKPPEVTGISISADEVLRDDSIYIYADVSDLEDPIDDLIPQFEYQNPNTGAWEDDYFDSESETVEGNQWRITFNPSPSAPMGSYYFRVRFSDSDGDLSEWEESHDSVYVENNAPEVSITTDTSQDSLEVTFTATVSDVEDSLSELEFRWVFGDGDTSTKQSPTHTYDEEGTYDITLRVTDKDDEEVFDEITITIDVAGGDGDGDGVDSGDSDDGGFNMMLLLGILIPIIIVVLLVVLLLARKKKKEEEIPGAAQAEVVAAPSMPQAAYVPQQPQVTTPITAPTPVQKVAAKKPGVKNIKCPRCKHTFGVEAQEGHTIMVQCPSCQAKGQMKF